MHAADILPIARPAAPPETAGAGKRASPAQEPKDASFADVLETEFRSSASDSVEQPSPPAASPSPASAIPPPAPPLPDPTILSLERLATAAPSSSAAAQADDSAPQPSVAPAFASAGMADAAAAASRAVAPVTAAPGGVQPKAPTEEMAAATLPVASPAPASPPLAAPQAGMSSAAMAPAIAQISEIPVKSANPSKTGQSMIEVETAHPAEGSGEASEGEVQAAASHGAQNFDGAASPIGPTAPDKPVLFEGAAAPAQPSTAASLKIVLKPAATVSETSPGAQRAADNAQTPAVADASSVPSKQTGSPGPAAGAATPPSSGAQIPAQSSAAMASDVAPAINVDVATPSPATSTPITLGAGARATADGQTAHSHPALQAAPKAAVQIYTRFIERFDGRAQRFEVRLDPAELGRVDVRIEVGADKKVHAILAAHDSAALTDLMRGQRALERALSDAGIDLSDAGLQFELAGESGRGLAGHERRNGAWPGGHDPYVWRGFSTVDVLVDAGATDMASASRFSFRGPRLDLVA